MKLEKELILYVFFGVLTTLTNFIVYLLFARVFHINYIISNVIAWIISVLFSYMTTRKWVFESENTNILSECILFFGSRFFAGAVDTSLMFLFIDILSMNDFISKIIIQVIVVILNYVTSKFFIFK